MTTAIHPVELDIKWRCNADVSQLC